MSQSYDYPVYDLNQNTLTQAGYETPVCSPAMKHPAPHQDVKESKKPRKTNGKIGTKMDRLKATEFLSMMKDDNYDKIILDLITERNILNKRISDLKSVNEALEREFTEFKTGLFTKRLENMEVEIN